MGSFAAAVANWEKETIETQTDVLHQSIRLLVKEATTPKSEGGYMPVVTGNLANSVAVSTSGPVTMDFRTKKFRKSADAVNNAVAGVEVGQTAWIGFRAPYAVKAEDANGYTRLGAQRWPMIVDEAARTTRRR